MAVRAYVRCGVGFSSIEGLKKNNKIHESFQAVALGSLRITGRPYVCDEYSFGSSRKQRSLWYVSVTQTLMQTRYFTKKKSVAACYIVLSTRNSHPVLQGRLPLKYHQGEGGTPVDDENKPTRSTQVEQRQAIMNYSYNTCPNNID